MFDDFGTLDPLFDDEDPRRPHEIGRQKEGPIKLCINSNDKTLEEIFQQELKEAGLTNENIQLSFVNPILPFDFGFQKSFVTGIYDTNNYHMVLVHPPTTQEEYDNARIEIYLGLDFISRELFYVGLELQKMMDSL